MFKYIEDAQQELQDQGYNVKLLTQRSDLNFLHIDNSFVEKYQYVFDDAGLEKTIKRIVKRFQKYPPFMIKGIKDGMPMYLLIAKKMSGYNGYATRNVGGLVDHIAFAYDGMFKGSMNGDTFEHELFHHFDEMDGMLNDDLPWAKLHKKGGYVYDMDNWKKRRDHAGSRERYGHANIHEDQATMGEVIHSPTMKYVVELILKKVKGWKTLADKLRLITGCNFVVKKGSLIFTGPLVDMKRYQFWSGSKTWEKFGYTEVRYYAKRSIDPINKKVLMNEHFWNAVLQGKNIVWKEMSDGHYSFSINIDV